MPEPLTRSAEDRILAGVCGGLARYLGLDTMLVRLAFLLLIPASGIGPLIYLVLWLLMPNEGSTGKSPTTVLQENMGQMGDTVSESVRRLGNGSRAGTVLAVVFILLGAFFLLQNMGSFAGLLLPLLLVGLVLYILMRRR